MVEILRDAVEKEGSQDGFAVKHYFSTAMISLTLAGKSLPGPSILNALGLERVVFYRRKNDVQKED